MIIKPGQLPATDSQQGAASGLSTTPPQTQQPHPVGMPIVHARPLLPVQQPAPIVFTGRPPAYDAFAQRQPFSPSQKQMAESLSTGSAELGLTLSNANSTLGLMPVNLPGLGAMHANFPMQVARTPPATRTVQAGTPHTYASQTASPLSAPTPTTHPTLSPSPSMPQVDSGDVGPRQLIVNYLSPAVTESELRAVFEEYGPVQCSRVIYDKATGVSKGYGFIYFYSSEHAAEALKGMQSFELYGKCLRVAYAVPQRPLPSL